MNDLDRIVEKLDELNRQPGRDMDETAWERGNLLEAGFRILVPKMKKLERRMNRDSRRRR